MSYRLDKLTYFMHQYSDWNRKSKFDKVCTTISHWLILILLPILITSLNPATIQLNGPVIIVSIVFILVYIFCILFCIIDVYRLYKLWIERKY